MEEQLQNDSLNLKEIIHQWPYFLPLVWIICADYRLPIPDGPYLRFAAYCFGGLTIANFIFLWYQWRTASKDGYLEFFKTLGVLNLWLFLSLVAISIVGVGLISLAAIVPESISAVFPLILAGGGIFYLISLVFRYLERNEKG